MKLNSDAVNMQAVAESHVASFQAFLMQPLAIDRQMLGNAWVKLYYAMPCHAMACLAK